MPEYLREGSYRKEKIEDKGGRGLTCVRCRRRHVPMVSPGNSVFLTHNLDRSLAFGCQPHAVN